MKDEKQPKRTKYKDVTAADVKACRGYEDVSDELGQRIADVIRVYTEIVYNCFKEERLPEQRAMIATMRKEVIEKAA